MTRDNTSCIVLPIRRNCGMVGGKMAGREYKKIYKIKSPEKHHAHKSLSKAVSAGRIKRLPCEVCGDPNTHGHHDDYTKRFEVRWLCQKHHFALHRTIKAQANTRTA